MIFTKEDYEAKSDWHTIGEDLDNAIKDEFRRAKRILKEHLEKYSHVDYEQQKKFQKEFEYLEKLRPELPD